MMKVKRDKHAKQLVMQPRFRPKREKPKRGKGSYRREKPRTFEVDRGFFYACNICLSIQSLCVSISVICSLLS